MSDDHFKVSSPQIGMRNLIWKVLWLPFASLLLLAGCGTRPMALGLIEKPKTPTSTIRVLYVNTRLNTENARKDQSAMNSLYRLGYFELGDKIKKLAPEILARRGIQAEGMVIQEEVYIGGGYREANGESATDSSRRMLILYFRSGQASAYGGPSANMDLKVIFSEPKIRTTYWRGDYKSSARQTPFGGVSFDEDFAREMLEQIFSDMEKSGLLPEPKK